VNKLLSFLLLALFVSACATRSTLTANTPAEIGYIHKDGKLEIIRANYPTLIARYNKYERKHKKSYRSKLKRENKPVISLLKQAKSPVFIHTSGGKGMISTGTSFNFKTESYIDEEFGYALTRKQKRKILEKYIPERFAGTGICYSLKSDRIVGRHYNIRRLLRLRTDTNPNNIDDYTFSNIYLQKKARLDEIKKNMEKKEGEKIRADNRLAGSKSRLSGTRSRLLSNENNVNGVCEQPVMEEIPDRPDVLSNEEYAFQIAGFCMELMSARYNRIQIYEMLSSGFNTELIEYHKLWKSSGGISNTPSCAVNDRSRLTDGIYQMLGNIGEAFLGTNARSVALESALSSCISVGSERCNRPIRRWQSQVQEIQNAPRYAQQYCEGQKTDIRELEDKIPKLEKELLSKIASYEAANKEYEKAKEEYEMLPDKIPLSKAYCSI